ncbi:hypothetical protein D3C76_1281200 [compost metagenome]
MKFQFTASRMFDQFQLLFQSIGQVDALNWMLPFELNLLTASRGFVETENSPLPVLGWLNRIQHHMFTGESNK